MAKNSEINLIIILLGQLCFLIITEAHYEELNVKIKNGDEIIKLKWKRTGEYLVNTNVPIWLANKDTQPVLAPRIMPGMGDIITYQDVEKSSAVIYMSKFKVFYGIIDTRFNIVRLPFDELLGPNIYHEVENGYIFSYDKKKNENNYVNYDLLAKLTEDDSKNGDNDEKNAEDDLKNNDENENEILDADEMLDYDDIITKLNQDDINAMNSILNSANEEDDEIAHGDTYRDKCQVQDYYDDILAKLTEDEEYAKNLMTDVNQDDTVEKAYDDNHILAELTPDELNLINSIIDSADKPSISGLSSEHMMQHDVGHDTPSTSAHVSQIEPITRSQDTVVHSKKLNIFYAEILIFVGINEVAKFTKFNVIEGIKQLILHYIVYFNAIDMLFAKLVTDNSLMHINIAGFVIELEPGTFPYGLSKRNSPYFENNPRIHADKTLFKFIKYIGKYKNIFPEDSFDFFFLSTNYAIQKNRRILPAYSRSSADIFMRRRRDTSYADLLGSIVHITDSHDFIFATRAIAELLKIEYVPSSEKSEICSKHNCDIMKKCTSFNQICLKWSKKSQYEFEGFFSSNPNRCFLLNYPRSLRLYNLPAMTTDPKTQCLCYGFNEGIVNEVCPAVIDTSACDKKLKCTYRMFRNNWVLPLDGTPCGNKMVCWRKICLETGETTTLNPVQSYSNIRKRLPEDDISETDEIGKKPRKSMAK